MDGLPSAPRTSPVPLMEPWNGQPACRAHSGQGRECLPGLPWPLKGGQVMGTDYVRRRGDADHLAAPQPAQVGMETTSGTVTGAGMAGSSSPGGSAARHAVICSSCPDLSRLPTLEVWSECGIVSD
jgi:hypothetical protein